MLLLEARRDPWFCRLAALLLEETDAPSLLQSIFAPLVRGNRTFNLMSGCFELARPVECSRAGFEYDCAPIDLREDREELVAHHSALQHEFPRMAGNSLQDAANSLLGLINSLFGEN
jgi:hypothetical protein